MADHAGCPDTLREAIAVAAARAGFPGLDLNISTAPPLVRPAPGQWPPLSCTCPHGTEYWIEPTGEQRAKWAAEGVRS